MTFSPQVSIRLFLCSHNYHKYHFLLQFLEHWQDKSVRLCLCEGTESFP